jgi:hypothetical protein
LIGKREFPAILREPFLLLIALIAFLAWYDREQIWDIANAEEYPIRNVEIFHVEQVPGGKGTFYRVKFVAEAEKLSCSRFSSRGGTLDTDDLKYLRRLAALEAGGTIKAIPAQPEKCWIVSRPGSFTLTVGAVIVLLFAIEFLVRRKAARAARAYVSSPVERGRE